MTLTVTHTFVSNIADDAKAAAAGEVLPSHWNAAHTVSGARTLLAGDTTYYVSTTGSDSNNGTTPATAFATLQHAVDVVSNTLDFANHNVTISVGAGSFVGAAVKATVGGGSFSIIGAGSGSTTITSGPNDGVFNFGECLDVAGTPSASVYINKATIKGGLNLAAIAIYADGTIISLGDVLNVAATDINFDCSLNPFTLVQVDAISSFVDFPFLSGFNSGGVTVTGANGTIFSALFHTQGLHLGGANWTVSGNLTVTTFTYIYGGGRYIRTINSQTFTGAGVTGSRYNLIGGAVVADANGAAHLPVPFFPGTTDGTVDASSSYDGFPGAATGSGLPTTTQFPNHGTSGIYKDTSGGGGVYSVYNDAGTIKKVQLT